MRIKPENSDWIDTNSELIKNVIALKTLNARSEKRIQATLEKIDIEGLQDQILQEVEKSFKQIMNV